VRLVLAQLQDNATLKVAIALAAGMLGQTIARHVRIPGIVFLLVLGVVLGPDGANVVQPATLGSGLSSIVGIAVAVILFEGGMSLEWRRIRHEGRAIRASPPARQHHTTPRRDRDHEIARRRCPRSPHSSPHDRHASL
jgi:uncharacterized membrane protein YccC